MLVYSVLYTVHSSTSLSYLLRLPVLALDVLRLTTLAAGEETEPVRTARTGDRLRVGRPGPALHPPVVHTVVVDGVSQRHLLDHVVM